MFLLPTQIGDEQERWSRWCGEGDVFCVQRGQEVMFMGQEGKLQTLPSKQAIAAFIPFWGLLTLQRGFNLLLYKDNKEEGRVTMTAFRSLGFYCPYCSHIVRDKYNLERHMPVHRGPVKCDHCDTEHIDQQTLEKHQKLCTVVCEVEGCKKSFTYKKRKSMAGHQRMHNR